MTDQMMHQKLVSLVRKEKEVLSQILEHLRIVFDQRIYAKRGHSSLFIYLVKELKYSEAAAYRRINAMKLIREIPEIKKNVENGELNLSNLARAAAKFREYEKAKREELSKASSSTLKNFSREKEDGGYFCKTEEGELKTRSGEDVNGDEKKEKLKLKKKVLQKLIGKSKSEAEGVLAEILPSKELPKEREKIVSLKNSGDENEAEKILELKLVLRGEEAKVVERLKELHPGLTVSEIFVKCSKEFLSRKDPLEKARKSKRFGVKAAKNKDRNKERDEAKNEVVELGERRGVADASKRCEALALRKSEGKKCELSAQRNAENVRGQRRGEKESSFGEEKNLKNSSHRRAIRQNVRNQVWLRDRGECQFRDHISGKKCGARAFLELDHLIPHSFGGEDSVENLQLVCRTHNLLRAKRKIGRVAFELGGGCLLGEIKHG